MSRTVPQDADDGWTREILPQRNLFHIPWKELWAYRDLIWLLARRDLATSYKQTVLGPLWFVLQPLMVTAVFSYLFGRMARFGTNDIPHFLFYMSGLVLWQFFADCVNKTARTFTDNQMVFSKVYFPRLAAPIASVMTSTVPFAIQSGIFIVGLVVYLVKDNPYVHPNWLILAAPLIALQVALFGFGLGAIVASLTKRFRDLVYGIQVGLQLWMFASAIVFPISRIAPHDRWIFFLNPMVPPIETFRLAFLGKSLIQPSHIVYSSVLTLVVLGIALVAFNRAEQTSVDTV